jgi:hypothetical protein
LTNTYVGFNAVKVFDMDTQNKPTGNKASSFVLKNKKKKGGEDVEDEEEI